MDKRITYDKMFNILNVRDIIIFEDDFSTTFGKNEICYGLARMSTSNREKMLQEMDAIDPICKDQLEMFVKEFDKVFNGVSDWENEIPYNDIETTFDVIQEKTEYKEAVLNVRKKYCEIEIDRWNNRMDLLNILWSYGVGLVIPNLYEDLFNEFLYRDAHWRCFRVFRDFSASTQEDFEKYLKTSVGMKGVIVCILDDQLRNKKCGMEIAQCIEKIQSTQEGRLSITGLIYSSFDNNDCISDKIYLEHIKKDASQKEFQAALIKSSYSYMLSELKKVYQQVLGEAFDEAVRSKNIAYYLSSMADFEGVTNYQVITNWIKLLFEYKLDDIQELTAVAGMTRLIGALEDEKLEFSKEMLHLNTFEAFDFSVNKYREPVASGDIFSINKKIYILLGQDCDMMNSTTRKRKNGISELVAASTINQNSIDGSVKLNSQYLFISNFRKEKNGEVKTLKVRYSSREFIENQILQLCQFNDEGTCILNTCEKQYIASGVEPEYYADLYEELQGYYKALLEINTSNNGALKMLLSNSQSHRVLSLLDYKQPMEGEKVEYKVRRICRLKHPYMLYLYKMYLEHQGRHPFDCMNMSRVQEMQVRVMQNPSIFVPVDMVLTPDREMNRLHIENMDWYIDANTLENIITNLTGTNIEIQGCTQCIEIEKDGTILECLANNRERKNMKIMKIDDMISIEEC